MSVAAISCVRNIYLRLDMFTQPPLLLKYIQSPTLPLLFNIATVVTSFRVVANDQILNTQPSDVFLRNY
jgi:hypothetical protein